MNQEAEETGALTLDDLVGEEEEEVVIIVRGRGDTSVRFIFRPLEEKVLRQYRTLYAGRPGSRKGNPRGAVDWLFENRFKRAEGLKLDLNGYPDEKSLFLKHPRGRLLMDASINGYLGTAPAGDEDDDIKE